MICFQNQEKLDEHVRLVVVRVLEQHVEGSQRALDVATADLPPAARAILTRFVGMSNALLLAGARHLPLPKAAP